jgi:hypothetical protein
VGFICFLNLFKTDSSLILFVYLTKDAYCIKYNKTGEDDEEATIKYVIGIANRKCRDTKVKIEQSDSQTNHGDSDSNARDN